MAASTTVGDVGGCPVCLTALHLAGLHSRHGSIECPRCKSVFRTKDTLPPDSLPAGHAAPVKPVIPRGNGALVLCVVTAVITFTTCGLTATEGLDVRGPQFLLYYAALVVLALLAQWMVRVLWEDRYLVSVMAFLLIESVGATRYITGYQQGMRRFEFLLVMMGVGAILQFLRAQHLANSNSGGCGAAGCGGGGCGGGGCGGGGCGGCGG